MRNVIRGALLCLAFAGLLSGCGDGGGKSGGVQTLNFSNFTSAAQVIGQPDFTSNAPNQGGAAGANTLFHPFGNPLVVNGRLYLPDNENNRILGFNSVSTTNNVSADFVLGQSDFTSTASGTAADALSLPSSVKYYNGKMIVCDFLNNRILIWNTIPTTSGVPADVVVGQTDFSTNSPATTQAGLSSPIELEVADGKLIVADRDNNRVLIWNTIPTANGTPADLVLGQNDFTSGSTNGGNANPSASTLAGPYGVWSDGTRLIVCDFGNHRVLIWKSFPTTNGAPADIVLGQSDFSHIEPNAGNAIPTAATLSRPAHITSNGVQLFLSDTFNNRVLIWNSFPTANFQAADRVLGQSVFTQNASNAGNSSPSAKTLSFPSGLYIYGKKLFVSDYSNNRCLIFQAQ